MPMNKLPLFESNQVSDHTQNPGTFQIIKSNNSLIVSVVHTCNHLMEYWFFNSQPLDKTSCEMAARACGTCGFKQMLESN